MNKINIDMEIIDNMDLNEFDKFMRSFDYKNIIDIPSMTIESLNMELINYISDNIWEISLDSFHDYMNSESYHYDLDSDLESIDDFKSLLEEKINMGYLLICDNIYYLLDESEFNDYNIIIKKG